MRFLLERSSSEVAALLLVKLVALGLGATAWLTGRRRLARANVFFALVVAWSLLALVVAKAASA